MFPTGRWAAVSFSQAGDLKSQFAQLALDTGGCDGLPTLSAVGFPFHQLAASGGKLVWKHWKKVLPAD